MPQGPSAAPGPICSSILARDAVYVQAHKHTIPALRIHGCGQIQGLIGAVILILLMPKGRTYYTPELRYYLG